MTYDDDYSWYSWYTGHYLKVYSVFHPKYLVLTMNILKAFFWVWQKISKPLSSVTLTPKSTFFFFFFWSLTGFFFPKKLVRQVIKLEWPNKIINHECTYFPCLMKSLQALPIISAACRGLSSPYRERRACRQFQAGNLLISFKSNALHGKYFENFFLSNPSKICQKVCYARYDLSFSTLSKMVNTFTLKAWLICL